MSARSGQRVRDQGEEGPPAAWPRWLAATGYLLQVDPDAPHQALTEQAAEQRKND